MFSLRCHFSSMAFILLFSPLDRNYIMLISTSLFHTIVGWCTSVAVPSVQILNSSFSLIESFTCYFFTLSSATLQNDQVNKHTKWVCIQVTIHCTSCTMKLEGWQKTWDCFIKEWVRQCICFYMFDPSTKLCPAAPASKLSDSVVALFLAAV